jgi:hypothetical protein
MWIKDKTVGVKPTHYATSPGELCVTSRFDPDCFVYYPLLFPPARKKDLFYG